MTQKLLSLLFLTLTACGQIVKPNSATVQNPSVTLTAAQVFSPHINDVYTFRDGYGHTIWITVQAAPSNFMPAGTINFVIQKNSCQAYWAVGICDALIHFALSPQPDGSWVSMASLFYFPTQLPDYANGHRMMTSNYLQVPGMPVPYTIVPASATSGFTSYNPTYYDRYDAYDAFTFDSIVSGPLVDRVRWQTNSYIENVSTPVYTGPAMVSEQFESNCIHEKWYFAPGLGLVKIIPLDNGSCTPTDPLKTIVRIS